VFASLMLVGCASSATEQPAGDEGALRTGNADSEDGVASTKLRYGVGIKGVLASDSASTKYTLLAPKGWHVSLLVRAGAGKPNPPFAVFPAFAPRLVVKNASGETVLDEKGNMTTGDVITQLDVPADGTYTLSVSAAETDGESRLGFALMVDPPDTDCHKNADCQMTIDGKIVKTGLTCQRSEAPEDRDSPKFCAVP
jgi:hypothetical protein